MSKISEALDLIHSSRSRVNSSYPGNDEIADANVVAELVSPTDEQNSSVAGSRILRINLEDLRDAGLIGSEYDQQLLADQYRDIKRPLIAHAFGKRATRIEHGNIIVVTSSIAGEGKTFTTINLALSMTKERDYTTLLVDADTAKPQISELLCAENDFGLLDVLENPDLDVHSAICPTDVKGLSVLPAGKPRPNATELLSSDAMDHVVDQLGRASSRQLILLDAPPLLQTSEAKALSGLAGQIVLVVRAEHTPRGDVGTALSLLNEDQAVNLLLNQARYTSSKYQYGYGYHAPEDKEEPESKEIHKSEIFE